MYRPGHFLDRERVDFLKFASEMQLDHVIANVLSYCSARDLCMASMVSATWNFAVVQELPPPRVGRRVQHHYRCRVRDHPGHRRCSH